MNMGDISHEKIENFREMRVKQDNIHIISRRSYARLACMMVNIIIYKILWKVLQIHLVTWLFVPNDFLYSICLIFKEKQVLHKIKNLNWRSQEKNGEPNS